MRLTQLVLCISVLFIIPFKIHGYMFQCLDNCICDTDDEVIHCHNGVRKTRVQLPENRLRGFTVLGLTRNDIRVLPSQDLLLEKLPDLQAVDVELNPNFECETLAQYDKITVLSSCDKSPDEIAALANVTTIVGNVGDPTEDCDVSCQTQRHYAKLHEYLERLWQMIRKKFEEMSKDSQFFRDVQEFFGEIGKRMKHFAKQVKHNIVDDATAENGDAHNRNNNATQGDDDNNIIIDRISGRQSYSSRMNGELNNNNNNNTYSNVELEE